MKKVLHLLLFFVFFSTSFSQDLKRYNSVLSEIDQVEKEIALYTDKNFKKIKVPKLFLKNLEQGGVAKEETNRAIADYKKSKLRERFFNKNPEYLAVYEQLNLRDLEPNSCVNPGFELSGGSTFSYSFYQHQYDSPPFFEACNMEINTNTPITPGTANDITAHVSLVTSGQDPVLSSFGINLCRTNDCTTRGHAIRLNNNSGGGNITTMRKNVVITGDYFIFNYASVMQHAHTVSDRPFFQVRIYDEFGNLHKERCIISDNNNCNFNAIQGENIIYSNWSCVKLNTSGLTGQNVSIEFSVADCGQGDHFGYVYIDDLCQGSCTPSIGYIGLFPQEEECPEFPIEVCGEFIPPMVGTQEEGNLLDIWLNILDSDQIVGVVTDVTVTGFDFCFNVEESDFPDPMASQYEFQVVAEFGTICTYLPYIITLTDTSTNIGPDIKCSLWPRTFGGIDTVTDPWRFISDIVIDDEENVYVVGLLGDEDISYEDDSFLSSGGGVLMKFDIFGNMIWIEYLPYGTYLHNHGDVSPNFNMELVNDKLIITTNYSYLLGYNLDGTEFFDPFQLYDQIRSPLLDVNEQTGEIYISLMFGTYFTNDDYTINASMPGNQIIGIFKFTDDGEYINHSEIFQSGNGLGYIGSIDIEYSESQNKLFLTGGSNNTTANFPNSSQITNQYFGVEYDDGVSGISFNNVVGFDNHIGKLTYNNTTDKLYVRRYGTGIVTFQDNFSGITAVVTSEFSSGSDGYDFIVDFYFLQQSQELYLSHLNLFGKIDNGGLQWDMTTPANAFVYAIAKGSNDYLYIIGSYTDNTMFGDFPVYFYNGSNYSLSLFVARLKEDGTSVEYRGIPGLNPFEETLTKEQSFLLYPNPAIDKLNIEPIVPEKTIALLTLYDLSGVEISVINNPDNINNNTSLTLETGNLQAGIYILRVTDTWGNHEYYRIVKK